MRMGKLPPEDKLDPDLPDYDYPGHFGEYCDGEAEEVETPVLEDMDQDPPPPDEEEVELPDDFRPEGDEATSEEEEDEEEGEGS